jgi:hypothetical protein
MPGITFVIVTGGVNDAILNTVIDSIEAENIPEYEVILVGGATSGVTRNNTSHISFDETTWAHVTLHGHPGRWTTRKKNLGIQAAKYDLVVPMHDYIRINPGWYQALLDFGFDWEICNHQCLLSNGVRADGWRIVQFPHLPRYCMIPYDIDVFLPYMMMQGNYWIAKKDTMLKYPLDEKLLWGMEEDTEWSRRVIPNCDIKMNPNCIVQYLKPRPDDANHAIDVQTMNSLNDYWNVIREWQTKHIKLHREIYGSEVHIE